MKLLNKKKSSFSVFASKYEKLFNFSIDFYILFCLFHHELTWEDPHALSTIHPILSPCLDIGIRIISEIPPEFKIDSTKFPKQVIVKWETELKINGKEHGSIINFSLILPKLFPSKK